MTGSRPILALRSCSFTTINATPTSCLTKSLTHPVRSRVFASDLSSRAIRNLVRSLASSSFRSSNFTLLSSINVVKYDKVFLPLKDDYKLYISKNSTSNETFNGELADIAYYTHATNNKQWYDSTKAIYAEYEIGYQPLLLLRTPVVPFDETFPGTYLSRMHHTYELYASGFSFLVHSTAFAVTIDAGVASRIQADVDLTGQWLVPWTCWRRFTDRIEKA